MIHTWSAHSTHTPLHALIPRCTHVCRDSSDMTGWCFRELVVGSTNTLNYYQKLLAPKGYHDHVNARVESMHAFKMWAHTAQKRELELLDAQREGEPAWTVRGFAAEAAPRGAEALITAAVREGSVVVRAEHTTHTPPPRNACGTRRRATPTRGWSSCDRALVQRTVTACCCRRGRPAALTTPARRSWKSWGGERSRRLCRWRRGGCGWGAGLGFPLGSGAACSMRPVVGTLDAPPSPPTPPHPHHTRCCPGSGASGSACSGARRSSGARAPRPRRRRPWCSRRRRALGGWTIGWSSLARWWSTCLATFRGGGSLTRRS